MELNKNELRIKYKELRQKMSVDKLDEMSLAIANNVLKLDVWSKTCFHVFLPIERQKEVNTEFVLHILQGKDKEIIISKSNFETHEMTHFLLTDNTKIKKNKFDIPEPTDGLEVSTNKIEVVFIPLLAYDKQGNRVGYGIGFYDIFLSRCKPETLKIGLSFFEPEPLISDISENDIKLDYCVSPNKIFTF